jgi:hypothetical protein
VRASVDALLDEAADVDPDVFILVVGIVVKHVFGNHPFFQSFLGDLAFEQQTPHCRAGRVGGKIGCGAMVRFMPALIHLAGIPGKEHVGMEFANPADQVFDHSFAILEFQQPVVIPEINVVIPGNAQFFECG